VVASIRVRVLPTLLNNGICLVFTLEYTVVCQVIVSAVQKEASAFRGSNEMIYGVALKWCDEIMNNNISH